MPGEALLALWQKTGFQGLKLAGYTGMKSSPYTEGALLSGEKPGLSVSQKRPQPDQESQVAGLKPHPPRRPGGS